MYFIFDTVRILSVTWVVAFHSQLIYMNEYEISENFFSYFISKGNLGVDVFFFLSGFLVLSSLDIHNDGLFRYLLRRFFRIFPLYFILSILFIILSYFMGKNDFSFYYFLSSVLFLSSIFGYPYPILYVGWSLEYEVIFYLFNSILLFTRTGLKPLFVFKIFLFTISLFFPVFLGFYLGVFVYIFYKYFDSFSWKNKTFFYLFFLLAFLIHYLIYSNIEQILCLIFCSSLIMTSSKLLLPRSKYSIILSNSTYAIYLVQVFTISAIFKIFKFFENLDVILFIFLTVFITIFTGLLLHLFVEVLLINKLKKVFFK